MHKIMNYKNVKRSKMLLLSSVVVFLLCLYIFNGKKEKKPENAFSATIPTTIFNGLGVNVHFAGNQIDIDMISDAGFNIVRTDLYWSEIEKKQGVYDFKTQGYDTLTSGLIKEDIRPYFILDYSNKLYEKNRSVVTKEGRAAFNRYVKEATQRYKNKGIIWEVWNEPNLDAWLPKPNISDYSLLLKQTSKTIKENDPSGIVVAPALGGINEKSLEWLEELFKKGILEYVDAISVHPHRLSAPESVTTDYQSLKTLIKKYSSKQIPIISGEWGYTTADRLNGHKITQEQQAAYLVRMFLINQLNNIPISIWYDWKNDGSIPDEVEHNFGLRQEDVNIPKQGYYAMNTFTYILSGYQLIERINIGNPNDYLLKFVNKEGEIVIVMWTIASNHDISFPLKNVKGQVMTMLGKKQGYYNSDINPFIRISDKPFYLIVD